MENNKPAIGIINERVNFLNQFIEAPALLSLCCTLAIYIEKSPNMKETILAGDETGALEEAYLIGADFVNFAKARNTFMKGLES